MLNTGLFQRQSPMHPDSLLIRWSYKITYLLTYFTVATRYMNLLLTYLHNYCSSIMEVVRLCIKRIIKRALLKYFLKPGKDDARISSADKTFHRRRAATLRRRGLNVKLKRLVNCRLADITSTARRYLSASASRRCDSRQPSSRHSSGSSSISN